MVMNIVSEHFADVGKTIRMPKGAKKIAKIIINGNRPENLYDVINNEKIGTWFIKNNIS